MNKISTRFKGGLVSNIITLMSGKVAAAGVTVVAVPIVARLFSPEHFGVAAVFISILTMLGPLSTLCYERAIVLPKEESDAIGLAYIAWMVLIIFNCCLMAILVSLYQAGGSVALLEKIGGLQWLIPAGLFVIGASNIVSNWHVRNKSYRVIAGSDVMQSTGMALSRITLGWGLESSVGALVAGYFIGTGLRLMVLGKKCGKILSILSIRKSGIFEHRFRMLVKEYRDFPLYNAPGRLFRAFGQNLPVLMLGYMFNPAIAGYYAMANRLLRIPMDVSTSSVRRVYIQRVAELVQQDKPLFTYMLKTTIIMSVIGVIPLAVIWYKGELIVAWILGEQWSEAGRYVQIMSPWLFSIWISASSSALVLALRKQKLWLWMQGLLTAGVSLAFVFAFTSKLTPIDTLAVFVSVASIGNFTVMLYLHHLARLNDKMRQI